MYGDYPTVFVDSMNHILEMMNKIFSPIKTTVIQLKDLKQVRIIQFRILIVKNQVEQQLEERKYLSLLVPI